MSIVKSVWVLSTVVALVSCAPQAATIPAGKVAPNEAVAAMGQSAQVAGATITPLALEEDSRCPSGVQCIQAGTVRVLVRVQEAGQSSVTSLGLRHAVQLKSGWLHLTHVCPQKIADRLLPATDYLFTFAIAASEGTQAGEGVCS